jgi:entry exclusion lipoprotein TrbK
MTTEHIKSMGLVALIAISTIACSPEAPKTELKVNDENCKPENITAIKDKTAQQQFAGACARRGAFKPSENKSW